MSADIGGIMFISKTCTTDHPKLRLSAGYVCIALIFWHQGDMCFDKHAGHWEWASKCAKDLHPLGENWSQNKSYFLLQVFSPDWWFSSDLLQCWELFWDTFVPWCGKWRIPCGRLKCRSFYRRPPDKACTLPTRSAGILCTAPPPPPASQTPPEPVWLPPVQGKQTSFPSAHRSFCHSASPDAAFTFFFSPLCMRDVMSCWCFCAFRHITSLICFTPYRALLTSSSTIFSPFMDSSDEKQEEQ